MLSPHEFVRLLGLIGTPRATILPGLLTGFACSATGTKGTVMPIDPAMLAKSIGTLTDLHPDQDLPATLQHAVQAAKELFDVDAAGVMLMDVDGILRWASVSDQRAQVLEDNQEVFAAGPCMEAFTTGRPAVMHDAKLERRCGEITLVFVDARICSGLSVPVDLGGGPIGTLDVYDAEPRGWDDSEVSALQAYAGVVASLLSAATKAQLKGALADQEAFSHLRRAARSSGRRLTDVAAEVAAGMPLPANGPSLRRPQPSSPPATPATRDRRPRRPDP
jgi:GAF domain-containing protein